MIAANRARRNGRSPRSNRRGVSAPPRRRGKGRKVTGAVEAIGAGAVGYGLALQKPSSSGTSTIGFLMQGQGSSALYQFKESIPFIGKDSGQQPMRNTVGAGAVTFAVGKVAKHVAPFLHRWGVKVSRHHKVAIV